jgi:hypothetical protein
MCFAATAMAGSKPVGSAGSSSIRSLDREPRARRCQSHEFFCGKPFRTTLTFGSMSTGTMTDKVSPGYNHALPFLILPFRILPFRILNRSTSTRQARLRDLFLLMLWHQTIAVLA